MKYLPWILLIVGAVVVFLLWPQTGTSDREKELDKENTSLLYKIDSLANRNKAILVDVRKDSIVYLQEKEAFNAKLEAKNRELAQRRAQASKSRAEVQALIDSVPKLGQFVADQDSVISSLDSLSTIKDHRIAAMEHAYGKLRVNMVGITANFESMLSAERTRYANATEIIALKDKELKKEKKGKLVAKILVPVSLIAGFLLGNSL